MTEFTRKQIREEINRIMHLCSINDFHDMKQVDDLVKLSTRNQMFDGIYGQKFVDRLLDIQEGQDMSNAKCIICNREIPENLIVCTTCMEAFHESSKHKYKEPDTPANIVFVEAGKVAMFDLSPDEIELIEDRENADKNGITLRDRVQEEIDNNPESDFSQAVLKERQAEEKLANELPLKFKLLRIFILLIIIAVIVISGFLIYKVVNKRHYVNNTIENIQNDAAKSIDNEEYQEELMTDLQNLHKINEDCVAWLYIPGTSLSYPVMQRISDESYYLNHDFLKQSSNEGCLILDSDSNLDYAGANLIIHGHHMKSGSMFGQLLNYKDQEYGSKHNIIRLITLDGIRTYELYGTFYSKVYYADQDVFKYYNYFGGSKDTYKEFTNNVKKLSCYETGVESTYGDEFITLSTCSYHTKNGRFVVVAKRIYQ